MRSMEALLAESIGSMTEAQKNKFFFRRTKGMSLETQVNLAKEVLVSESQPIRRNNGASSYAESDPRAESDAILAEAIAKRDPAFAKAAQVSEAGVASLTPKQRADYEFCRLLHMSESDALKVANSNVID